jgi:hypothetical protein
MPKFIVTLWLDGIEGEENQKEACREFIENQLDFSASSVKVEDYIEPRMVGMSSYTDGALGI